MVLENMMNKSDVQLDMRVSVGGMGRGTVVDLFPTSKFYVKVKFDLDSKKWGGQEVNAPLDKMKLLPPPPPTREEKHQALFQTALRRSESYFIAGIVAIGPSRIHVSSPPKQLEATRELLMTHGVDFDETHLTESTDRTQGRSISVILPNHGMVEEFEKLTDIRSTYYQGQKEIVSIQARQFVLDFLLDFLKFRLGNECEQDINLIRSRVPKEFISEFERGVAFAQPDVNLTVTSA